MPLQGVNGIGGATPARSFGFRKSIQIGPHAARSWNPTIVRT
jgi:hypothetical protein